MNCENCQSIKYRFNDGTQIIQADSFDELNNNEYFNNIANKKSEILAHTKLSGIVYYYKNEQNEKLLKTCCFNNITIVGTYPCYITKRMCTESGLLLSLIFSTDTINMITEKNPILSFRFRMNVIQNNKLSLQRELLKNMYILSNNSNKVTLEQNNISEQISAIDLIISSKNDVIHKLSKLIETKNNQIEFLQNKLKDAIEYQMM